MKGLTPSTAIILEAVSKLECIKPYVLVGGTALSLQLGNRESEDLDFMSWSTHKGEKREVDWPQIKKELETVGNVEHYDILDIDHIEFILNGIKLSFYANPHRSPLKAKIPLINNIVLADKTAIGAMKMEVMLRRSKFRDYYDIYSLLEAGENINELISLALKYSDHKLKSKNLIAMLTRSSRFVKDNNFDLLKPIYNVQPEDIEQRIIAELKRQ